MGVGFTHLTTKNGQRHSSSAAAFLRPAPGAQQSQRLSRVHRSHAGRHRWPPGGWRELHARRRNAFGPARCAEVDPVGRSAGIATHPACFQALASATQLDEFGISRGQGFARCRQEPTTTTRSASMIFEGSKRRSVHPQPHMAIRAFCTRYAFLKTNGSATPATVICMPLFFDTCRLTCRSRRP